MTRTSKAILLAAGVSSRLRPLTDDRPKPMVPLAGKPLIEYNIERLARFGVRDIGINLHYLPEVVQHHFGDGARHGVRIVYSVEHELLGTSGAVKALAGFVASDRTLIHYGDNLTSIDFDGLERFHIERGGIATVALFSKEDVTPHSAVEFDGDGRITRFVEKPKAGSTESRWISAGVIIVEPRVLDYVPANTRDDFGFDLFPRLLAAGEPVFGYQMGPAEGLWWIDTPADYQRMSELAATQRFW